MIGARRALSNDMPVQRAQALITPSLHAIPMTHTIPTEPGATIPLIVAHERQSVEVTQRV